MRKVRMLTAMAGNGYTLLAGQEIELPAPIAKRYVEHKVAEYVDKAEGVKPSAPPAKRTRKATSKKKVENR